MRTALSFLESAIQAVQDMTVNGRDYYLQEDGALYAATDEHIARISALAGVKEELEMYHYGIMQQRQEIARA